MNVASLELCKELHKLSGWETGYWFSLDERSTEPFQGTRDNPFSVCPAYSLGYLLRKLPTTQVYHGRGRAGDYKAEWHFYGGDNKTVKCWADTPEDALTLLAIELIKQGIIKP